MEALGDTMRTNAELDVLVQPSELLGMARLFLGGRNGAADAHESVLR